MEPVCPCRRASRCFLPIIVAQLLVGDFCNTICHEETSRAMGCPSRDTNRGWLRFDYSLNPISAFIFRISASSSGLSVASVSWMATFFKAPVNLNGTW
jgi:hypothetical protein